MKKLVALVLSLVMVLGCTAALADKVGLGSVTSIGSIADAADGANGKGQVNTTIAAVLVDDEGKVISVSFDVAQNSIVWDDKGAAVTEATTEAPTKLEKGDAYNMKPASPIGKEWFEQAAFFEEYCVGKTVEEIVAGIAADEAGYPTGADVVVGATMHLNEFVAALEKAIANAK